uniref:Chromosome transmission fidelity protein 18 homolog n=1 Tax=Paramormyrops kingsleyae TaxID=1676925 RepID=A0A3B3Q225_9TELE
MDEYDEMYGIEDDFESQFADELEVLAEIDTDSRPLPKKSERRTRVPTSFEEALASGDSVLRTQPAVKSQKASPDDLETLNKCDSTPKAKRQRQDVVKKLKFDSADDGKEITPPSSPEEYPSEIRSQNSHGDSRTPAVTPGALDISGLEVLQASPQRAVRAAQHILHRPPPVGDFISVTGSSGDRVYLAKREDEDASDGLAFRRSQYSLGLLSVPIEVLKEQVAERRHQQLVEESQRLTKIQVDQEFGEMDSEEPAEGKGAQDEGGKDAASRLWVDKYSPAHYTELLSDDVTGHRCSAAWGLKLLHWKRCGSRSREGKDQQTSRFKTKTQMTEEILEAELDQYHRPKYKVALLSGPPGLGKTTLAHVIARHAGYNVVEMNASDDRSAELFQKRIDTATQMKSVLGANERPNCLVIDEIDGAPSAAINVLLAIMNRKETRDTEPVAGGGISSALKKKKKESILMRPIICICNDLYVPALRQLRQQAFLLSFPLTQPSRLVQRLVEISRCQGMRVDTGALMALCEKTENDIRSCINTLQFLHGRGQRQLDQRTVQSVQVGLKDQNKGLFSIWQEIFQLPRTKRKRVGDDLFAVVPDGGLGSAGAQRLQHILHLATSCGEHEKLTNGLYDNFLSMKLKDSSLQAVCMALDWLAFSDLLGEAVMHNQNFSLLRYLPFLPGAFHLLFAATSVPRINYPNSHYEAVTRMQQTRNALVAMLAEVPPSIRSRVGPRSLSLEVLSLLLEVVCPKLRPVNPQLYSTREKQQLVELIDTMMCYNLTYRQDRTPEGQYRYLLEPNVEDAVRFPGVPPRRQLTYQAKQMIARELELEKMRRAEAVLLARNPLPEEGKAKTKADPKSREKRLPMENHRQRLETILKQNVVESKPEVDFFGRAIVPRVKPELTAASAEGEKTMTAEQLMGKAVGNSDVWFRFNEGVSNAVRRNVYIKDLL